VCVDADDVDAVIAEMRDHEWPDVGNARQRLAHKLFLLAPQTFMMRRSASVFSAGVRGDMAPEYRAQGGSLLQSAAFMVKTHTKTRLLF